jgi:hypothetical protein
VKSDGAEAVRRGPKLPGGESFGPAAQIFARLLKGVLHGRKEWVDAGRSVRASTVREGSPCHYCRSQGGEQVAMGRTTAPREYEDRPARVPVGRPPSSPQDHNL